MKRVGTIIIGSFAILNIITLFMADRFPLGDKSFGEYSIYSSAEFFYVYHIWGIILAGVCVYAMWKEIRMLFMISLFLLCVVMFYPYFTSTPTQPQTQPNKTEENTAPPSNKSGSEQLNPAPQDTVSLDTFSQ